MFSFFSWTLAFLLQHLDALIGYGICVLFPIPWLNSFIIAAWAKLGTQIMALLRSFAAALAAFPPTTTPVATPTTPTAGSTASPVITAGSGVVPTIPTGT